MRVGVSLKISNCKNIQQPGAKRKMDHFGKGRDTDIVDGEIYHNSGGGGGLVARGCPHAKVVAKDTESPSNHVFGRPNSGVIRNRNGVAHSIFAIRLAYPPPGLQVASRNLRIGIDIRVRNWACLSTGLHRSRC